MSAWSGGGGGEGLSQCGYIADNGGEVNLSWFCAGVLYERAPNDLPKPATVRVGTTTSNPYRNWLAAKLLCTTIARPMSTEKSGFWTVVCRVKYTSKWFLPSPLQKRKDCNHLEALSGSILGSLNTEKERLLKFLILIKFEFLITKWKILMQLKYHGMCLKIIYLV